MNRADKAIERIIASGIPHTMAEELKSQYGVEVKNQDGTYKPISEILELCMKDDPSSN